ncbi:hypothetical protein ACTXG7_04070 [Mycolicibacterium sp. Dal123E01]|uniref:hypothetical protein n=1 Tax=Mycolicibacterium sp. Dal123E01 TaxID=3457578 RepID=UPI00403EBC1F
MEKHMEVQGIVKDAAIGLVGAAAMFAVGTGVAAAAPAAPSATETIARLQADGNRVIVNKVGAGPAASCTVKSVSSVVNPPLPTGNALTGVPNLQRVTTVHVSLQC